MSRSTPEKEHPKGEEFWARLYLENPGCRSGPELFFACRWAHKKITELEERLKKYNEA